MDSTKQLATKIVDALMFISGINKPGNQLIPALNDQQAGPYNHREAVELVESTIRRNFVEHLTGETDKQSDFQPDDWTSERSSGYAGYRHKTNGNWIYEKDYLELCEAYLAERLPQQDPPTVDIHQWYFERSRNHPKLGTGAPGYRNFETKQWLNHAEFVVLLASQK